MARELRSYLLTPLYLLGRELRRQHCVTLLCSAYESGQFTACALLSRVINVRLIGVYQGRAFASRQVERAIRRRALAACDGLIIGAGREIQRVREAYSVPANKIAHIQNPVDTERWYPGDRTDARLALGIPIHAKVAVWHGRTAIHHKGLDVLIDAWGHVCDALGADQVQLLLVGSGAEASEVRRQISARGYENVIFRDDFVNDVGTLRTYLTAADVYVLSSRWEGFPIAVLEAMACGLPVVATDVDGIRDALGSEHSTAESIVSIEDSAALGRSIAHFFESEDRRVDAGRAARQRAVERFGPEAVGRQLRNFVLADT